MATLTYSDTLTIIDCGVCAIPFAIPQSLYNKVRRDGSWFWCPNGHHIHYYEDDNTKLKAQLDQAQTEANWQRSRREHAESMAKHNEAVARGYKGALTKTKKRIGNGVCPCCNRHFADVERHMNTKHPDYANGARSEQVGEERS